MDSRTRPSSHAHSCAFYDSKAQLGKGSETWGAFWGNQVLAFKGPLQCSHTGHTHSSGNSCDNTCELLLRDSVSRVFSGAGHVGALWHVAKVQTPRRKAGVWHRPYYSSSLGADSHPYLLGNRVLPKSGLLDSSQGPALDSGLSKDEQSQTCRVNCFLHRSALPPPCRFQRCQG